MPFSIVPKETDIFVGIEARKALKCFNDVVAVLPVKATEMKLLAFEVERSYSNAASVFYLVQP